MDEWILLNVNCITYEAQQSLEPIFNLLIDMISLLYWFKGSFTGTTDSKG